MFRIDTKKTYHSSVKLTKMTILNIVIIAVVGICGISGNMIQITHMNHDEVMLSSRLSFVAFTADWCPYSRALLDVYNVAATEYNKTYPERKTIWANIDCVAQTELGKKYGINKYPTMMVFFYGYLISEYRGTRNMESLTEYLTTYETPNHMIQITHINSFFDWQNNSDKKKGTVVLWFPKNSAPYELMMKAIALIHDRVIVLTPEDDNDLKNEEHHLLFSKDGRNGQTFTGRITNFNELADWMKHQANGIVRELTFVNAEELAEQGKPFLLLFRDPKDETIDEKYTNAIRRELDDELCDKVTVLITDGFMMSHPLTHINKKPEDMPVLIIDQFVHAYPLPYSGDDIFKEGVIKQFVLDLVSDTLHKRFHGEFAPDQLNTLPPNDQENVIKKEESVFKKLKPGTNRYSFKTEL